LDNEVDLPPVLPPPPVSPLDQVLDLEAQEKDSELEFEKVDEEEREESEVVRRERENGALVAGEMES
jgi:hypothetical protein